MKALISKNENGRICEIKQDSDTFEVHESMVWVDIPESENIAPNTHLYDIENKKFPIHIFFLFFINSPYKCFYSK